MTRQRRKGHNRQKRSQRFMAGARVWTWEAEVNEHGDQIAHAYGKTPFGYTPLERDIAQKLMEGIHNWRVCVRAVCRAPDDDVYFETAYFTVRQQRLNAFSGTYMDLRLQVLDAVNIRHVVDLGWICQPFYGEDTADSDERWYRYGTGDLTEERRQLWRQRNEDILKEVRAA